MDNIVKRNTYNNINIKFDEMLENSNELVLATIKILETKIDNNKYKIISNFDNTLQGVIGFEFFKIKNLNEENFKLFKSFSNKRFKTKKDLFEYINKNQILEDGEKFGMRAHDIAIVEIETNNIIALFECKDFPQLIYYPETGLPIFYIEKLTLLKKILEQEQNQSIQHFFVFQDNKELEINRKSKNINLPIINEPYFIEFKNEDVYKLRIKTNKNGDIIPTHFLKEIKNEIPEEALQQHTWKIKNMKLLQDIILNNTNKGINYEQRIQNTRTN